MEPTSVKAGLLCALDEVSVNVYANGYGSTIKNQFSKISGDHTSFDDTTGIVCPENISTYTDVNSCNTLISSGLELLDPGNTLVSLSWQMEGATEGNSTASGINQLTSFVFNEGTTIVTYRGRDRSNQPIYCSFSVVVADNEVPRLMNPPQNISVEADPGDCHAIVNWQEPIVLDNCASRDQIVVDANYMPGSAFPVGTTEVFFSISDGVEYNRDEYSFTVTVTDDEKPEIYAPGPIRVKCGDPVPDAFTSWREFTEAGGVAFDNCNIDFESFRFVSQKSSGIRCPYTVTRIYSITDDYGNITEVEHLVYVTGEEEVPVETQTEPSLKSGTGTTAITISVNITDVSCFGGADGAIDLDTSSTAGPITSIVWSNGATTLDLSSLSAGSYSVDITDGDGTQNFGPYTVGEPAVLNATKSSTDVSCNGANDGTVTVSSPTGGHGTYNYRLNGGTWQSSGSFSGLPPGNYTVEIQDATYTSCNVTLGVENINEPPVLTASISAQTETCFGQSTGTATISAGGGTPPYTYSKDGTTFQSNATLTGLSAGVQTITVKDNNSCEATTTVNIVETVEFSPGTHNTADVEACPGYNPVTLQILNYTGKAPFTFQWYHNGSAVGSNSDTYDPGQLTAVQTHTFYCTVTDACGFTANTASKAITIVDEPQISINNGGTYCLGESINLTTTITGGTGSFTNFVWREGSSSSGPWTEITGETGPSYTPPSNVVGTKYYQVELDPNVFSCNNTSASVSVTINPIPTINPIANDSLCHDETFAGLTFSGTNVTRYEWTNDNTSIGLAASGTGNLPSFKAVNYGNSPAISTIEVTPVYNNNGVDCYGTTETFTIKVNQIVKPTVQINIANGGSSTICEGTEVSFFSVVSDTSIYTPSYQWKIDGANAPNGTGPTFTYDSFTTGNKVTLEVTTNAPCPQTAVSFAYTMIVNPIVIPSVYILESDNDICAGQTVSFNAYPSNEGSTPTYTWQFSDNNADWMTVGSNSTTYTSTSLTEGDWYFRVNLHSTQQCASPEDTVSESVKITVNPELTPEVTILASTNDVCPGTSIQFTAAPTYGGPNPQYQWKRNGNNVGSNLPTYTSTSLTDNDSVWVVMTSDTACASVNPVSSNKIYVDIKPGEPAIPGTITGTADVCAGNDYTYSVSTVANAERYIWNTDGWTIVSGDSTNTITVTAGTADAVLRVYAENSCGASDERTKAVTVADTSVAPTGITVTNNNTCEGSAKTLTQVGGTLGDGAYWVWYINGCEGDSIGTGNSITVDPNAGDTITYYVQAKGDCNTTACASVDVIVKPSTPLVPGDITGIDSVCPGTSEEYFISPVEGANSYSWSVPAGWTITGGQGGTLITVTTGSAGQNGNIRVTATNDCGTSTAKTLPVVVNPGAPATPGVISGDNYLCAGTQVTYSISSVANTERYIWDAGGWTVVSNDSTTSITLIAGASDATISVYAENDCGASSGTSTLDVITEDNAALIAPDTIYGPTAICPTLSTHFYTDPVDDADGYIWTFPQNWDIGFGDGTDDVTVTVKGTSNSGWVTVAAYNVCDTTEADSFYVSVADAGYVYAGPDIYVCEGTVQVYMAGEIGGAIQDKQDWYWESSNYPEKLTGNPKRIYFKQPEELGTLYDFPDATNPNGKPGPGDSIIIVIHSEVNVVGCGELSDTMKIFILPRPVIYSFTTDTVCEGEAATLVVKATPNTQVEYIIDLEDVGTVEIGADSLGYIITDPLTGSVTYDLIRMSYLDASKNTCIRAISGKAVIVVNQVPEVNAGTDITACSSDSMVQLNGSVTGVVSGVWSGGNGYFSPDSAQLDAVYYPTASEMNSGFLTLTLTSDDPDGPCGTVSDQVDITFDQAPTVNAGVDDTICATGTAQLAGSYGGAATSASWTTTGNGSFDNAAKNTAIYSPGPLDTAAGQIYLIYTTNNPGTACGAASDTMLLTINPAPGVDAGAPQTICGRDTVYLNGTLSGSAVSATWSGGAGTFSNVSDLNAFYVPTNAEVGDGSVELTLTSNDPDGPCGPVSDVVIITINPKAVVDAGSDQTICAGSNIVLEGSISGAVSQGTWSGGSNQFSPSPATLNATYIPGPSDADSVILILTSDDPGLPCEPVSDTMILYIDPVPSISISPSTATICDDDTLFLQGTVDPGFYGTWTTDGVGDFYPSDTSKTAYYVPGNGDVFNETVTIVYTSNDPAGPCGPVTDTMLLTVKERIQITTQPVNTGVCALHETELFVNAVGDNLSYQWYKVGVAGPLTNTATLTGVSTSHLHFVNATSATDDGDYYVEITSDVSCGATISDTVSLNVDQEIEIESLYNSGTVCLGEDILFKIVAIPGGVLEFKWIHDGDTIPGQTGDTLKLENVDQSFSGDYSVYITGMQGYTCSDAESVKGKLVVLGYDTITPLDPDNRTFCLNTPDVEIKYELSGGASGAVLTGALPVGMDTTTNINTGEFIIFGSPETEGTFDYSITTLGFCRDTTIADTIFVNAKLEAPVITIDQPEICYLGDPDSVYVSMPPQGGTGPFVYQWQDSVAGGSWSDIGTGTSYDPSGPLADTTYYRIIATDNGTPSCGTVTSTVIAIYPSDDEAPTFTVPTDKTRSCSSSAGSMGVPTNLDDKCTDVADLVVTHFDHDTTYTGCNYSFMRTWQVEDESGNVALDTQLISIIDTTPPTLFDRADNITIGCEDSRDPDELGWSVFTDNCDDSITVSYYDVAFAGDCPGDSVIHRYWIASDRCGNVDTASSYTTITITDITPPVVLNEKDTILRCAVDLPLATEIPNFEIVEGCGNYSIILLDEHSYGIEDVSGYCPYKVDRIWRVRDECGNSVEFTQTYIITQEDDCTPCKACLYDNTYNWADLTGNADSTITFYDVVKRDKCCGTDTVQSERNYYCASFNIKIDPTAIGVEILVDHVTPPGQGWKVDCEDVDGGKVVCLEPGRFHLFTFCKSAASDEPQENDYTFRSIGGILEGGDIETREECDKILEVNGSFETITWNSVYPGTYGQYNNLLSGDSDTLKYFNAVIGSPPHIQYEVCGSYGQELCFTDASGVVCDTLDVYVHEAISLDVSTIPDVMCEDDVFAVTPEINPPGVYDLQWFSGPNATGTSLGTGESFIPTTSGTYSVVVVDNVTGLGCNRDTINFPMTFDYTGPTIKDSIEPLYLDCNDPNYLDVIDSWLTSPTAEYVNADGDVVSTPVNNNYDEGPGVTLICGDSLQVEFSAFDQCSNDTIEYSYIIVIDTTKPVLTPAQDTGIDCISGDPDTDPNFVAWLTNHGGATATDGCDDSLSWTNNVDSVSWSGDPADNQITVTFTVTDHCGNYAQTSATFSVIDTTPPWLDCPGNFADTISSDSCSISTLELDSVFAHDLCSDPTLDWTLTGATTGSGTGQIIGQSFNAGVTTVHYTATDEAGLTDTCSFTVWVKQLQVPPGSFDCPDPYSEAYADAVSCDAYVPLDVVDIVDPCDVIDSVWHNSPAPDATPEDASGTYETGLTTFHWFIHTTSGALDSCEVAVYVIDTTKPIFITCPDNAVDSLYNNDCDKISDEVDDPQIGGDCSPLILTYDLVLPSGATVSDSGFASEYPFPIGLTQVYYTLADTFGNEAYCDFTVLIKSDLEPGYNFDCPDPGPHEVWADASCLAYVALDTVTILDTCNAIDSIWHDSPALNTTPDNASGDYEIGLTTFHWFIRNYSGSVDSCEVNVMVYDTLTPSFSFCPPSVEDTLLNNDCDLVSALVQDPVISGDCSPLSLTYELILPDSTVYQDSGFASGYPFPIGTTHVYYTLADTAGNESYCDFTVLIKDDLDPGYDYECPDPGPHEAYADSLNCVASVGLDILVVTDTCDAIDSVWHDSPADGATASDPSGDFPIGETTFHWYVRNYSNFVASCEVTVIVYDTFAPSFTYCPPDVEDSIVTADCYKIPDNIQDPIISDDCSPLSLTYELYHEGTFLAADSGFASSYPFPVGKTQVYYTLADSAGNEVYCDHEVWIKQPNVPEGLYDCPQPEWIVNAAYDSCEAYLSLDTLAIITNVCDALDSIWHNSPYGTDSMDASGFYPIGTTTFWWFISDLSGNVDSCQVDVIVNDYPLELVCPPDTVIPADWNDTVATGVYLLPPFFHDNCPDSILTWRTWGATTLTGGDTLSSGEMINVLSGPNTFNQDTTWVEYTFKDRFGDSIVCDFTVVVTAAPVIECPPSDTFYADNNCVYPFDPGIPELIEGAPPIDWYWEMTGATTGSGSTLNTSSPPLPDSIGIVDFNLGETRIQWIATNVSGSDTCEHYITVIDTTPPTIYQLDSLQDCMEEIISAVYSPTADDLYEPDRPDYLYFEPGDTTLDLTIFDEFDDNCELSCGDSVTWVIDFSPYTDQHGVNWPAQDSAYYGSGQVSEYGAGMWFPGDGTYMGNVEHWVSYFVTDCSGNTSLVEQRKIIVTPRPKLIKMNEP